MLTTERWTKPAKPPKQKKNEPKIERDNPLCSHILERLQKFRENLVDDEVLERGDSHTSFSHLDNHAMERLFRLVHWLKITL